MIIDPFLNNPKTLYFKKFMSHSINSEILESLFDEQIETVQKRFPSLSNREVEIIAARRAKRLFWEMAQ